jgi:hypothetical protein
MTYLYDHIQELRAELRACRMSRRERAQVQADLAQAIAEQAELDRAFEAALGRLVLIERKTGDERPRHEEGAA